MENNLNKQEVQLLESFIDNQSIQINQDAKDWKEAISILFQPLIKNQICGEKYVEDVIETTNTYGPYYIITPKVAMPHATSDVVEKDGFALACFKNKVYFNDNDWAQIFIGFCTKNPKDHLNLAIPQIVKLFEPREGRQDTIEKMLKAKSKEEIIEIIKNALK